MLPTFEDVLAAAPRIKPHIHRTPVLTSATLNSELGAEVFFKCENLQKIGAFKARGATNAVRAMSEAECERGVITHSSGNHGAAVAFAAAARGARCKVVMQEGASPLKAEAIRGYGAEVVICPRGQRETMTEEIAAAEGMSFIHPFEDPAVISGQGTAALELLEQVAALDAVITPIGGGGLMSGTPGRGPGSGAEGGRRRLPLDAGRPEVPRSQGPEDPGRWSPYGDRRGGL